MDLLNKTVQTPFTITAANVSQVIRPDNNRREYLAIQNTSNVTMYVRLGRVADTTAWQIPKGGSRTWEFKVPIESINILCSVAGATGVVEEGIL